MTALQIKAQNLVAQNIPHRHTTSAHMHAHFPPRSPSTMGYLEGINAHLVIQDTALPEYTPPPSEQRDIEPNTKVAYVEVVPNRLFSVFIEILPNTPRSEGNALIFRVFLDGTLCAEHCFRMPPKPTKDGPDAPKALAGYLNGKDDVHALCFPHVVLETNESKEVFDAEDWDGKEVVLQVSQARSKRKSADTTDLQEADKPTGPTEDPESVFAFIFKYRPRVILQSLLNLFEHQPGPWEESRDVTDNRNMHPADRELKKSMRYDHPEIYCYCRKVLPYQEFVSCDNDLCEFMSFHLKCVDLDKQPSTPEWFCPTCRERSREQIEMKGWTQFLKDFEDPACGCDTRIPKVPKF